MFFYLYFVKNIKRLLTLICMKYFCKFTAWNESPGTHKMKCSINQTKWIFCHLNQTSVLFNKENTSVTVWFRKYVCFLKRDITLHIHTVWRLATTFTRKMPESSDSMYSFFLMLENIFYLKWPWNCEFFSNCGSTGTRTKF